MTIHTLIIIWCTFDYLNGWLVFGIWLKGSQSIQGIVSIVFSSRNASQFQKTTSITRNDLKWHKEMHSNKWEMHRKQGWVRDTKVVAISTSILRLRLGFFNSEFIWGILKAPPANSPTYIFFVSALLRDYSLCWDCVNGAWLLHLTQPCLLALGRVLIQVCRQLKRVN